MCSIDWINNGGAFLTSWQKYRMEIMGFVKMKDILIERVDMKERMHIKLKNALTGLVVTGLEPSKKWSNDKSLRLRGLLFLWF